MVACVFFVVIVVHSHETVRGVCDSQPVLTHGGCHNPIVELDYVTRLVAEVSVNALKDLEAAPDLAWLHSHHGSLAQRARLLGAPSRRMHILAVGAVKVEGGFQPRRVTSL